MAEAWGNASTDSIDSTTEANIFDVLAATSMMTSDSEGGLNNRLKEAHGRIAELEAQVQMLAENEKRALKESATLRAMMLAMKGQLSARQAQQAAGGSSSMLSPGGRPGDCGLEHQTPMASDYFHGSAPKRQLQYNAGAGAGAGEAIVRHTTSPPPPSFDDECTVVHILRDSAAEPPGFGLGRHVPGRGYKVNCVVEGGPAEIAGLTTGDTITSIDDCDLRNVGLDLATDCIRRASCLMTIRLGPEADDAVDASFGGMQPARDVVYTSTPMKPAVRGSTRSFYERSAGQILPVMPVSAADVPEHMRIKANIMGMEASAPDLWTFFLGWRRWRAKMSAKSQVTARYLASGRRPGDAGYLDAGARAIAEGLDMAGLLPDDCDRDDLLAAHGVPGSDNSSFASNGSVASDGSTAISDSESLLMEYAIRPNHSARPTSAATAVASPSRKRPTTSLRGRHRAGLGRKMPSDKDYLQLESLIQSRRAQLEMVPGQGQYSQGSSSLLDHDEARIAALGLQAEYELIAGTETDGGDGDTESNEYSQGIAASVYTSDLYVNDTADTAVAWEQFKSLFSPAVPPPATAVPTEHTDVAMATDLSFAAASASVAAEALSKFAASEDQFQSIDLDYDSNHDTSGMASPSPSEPGSQWSCANLNTPILPDNLESAAERAWRNNYLSTANEVEAAAPPIVASPRRPTAKSELGAPENASTPTPARAKKGIPVTGLPPRWTAAATAATATAVSPARAKYDQNGRRVVVGGTRPSAVSAKGLVAKAAADARTSCADGSSYSSKAPTSSLSKKSAPKKRVNMSTGAKGIFAQSLAAVRADPPTEAAATTAKAFDGNRTMARPAPSR